MKDDYATPDPVCLRHREAAKRMSTPESLAENKFKAERLADLERFAELDAHTMLRLSDDELAEFVAPDPYAKGIRALLEAKR